MNRTIYNCGLIKKMVKEGLGEPQQWYNIEKCEGYQRGANDDKHCEQCKKCRYCISHGEE